MIEYRIKIDYKTGDSLHNENAIDVLELTWQNIDIAKRNLNNIKEHYEQYRELNNHRFKMTEKQLFEQNKDKEWFVNIPKLYNKIDNCAIDEKHKNKVGDGNWEYRSDRDYAEICMNLITDNESKMQMNCFWCGYFERLNSAEIVIHDENMKIEF